MRSWDFCRTADSVRILAELGMELGLPLSRVLSGTGVEVAQLQSPDTVIEARQELRLISNLVEALDHIPALGVIAGERYHFNTFGALGFALVSSLTLRDAYEIGLKYVQLTFAFCRVSLEDQGDQTHILLDTRELPQNVRQFIAERDSACIVTLQRDIFNRVSPLESMAFSFPAPPSVSPYESFYGVTPTFDRARNVIALNRAILSEKMPQASEFARRAAEQQCEQLLNQRLMRGGLAAKVRQHLATHASDMPDMASVAAALNTIPRTLRRRLLNENTSFAELRDEVRQALAKEYLSLPGLSIEQVSERLGYAAPTSFINAYKRWYGATPSAHRFQRGRKDAGHQSPAD